MKTLRILLAAATSLAFGQYARPALAAGIFTAPQGVRPLSRGGAFVAGADDLESMWYNPGGLMEAGTQFEVEAAYLNANSTYQRQSYTPSSSTGQPAVINSYPQTQGSAPFVPLPAIGGSHNFGLKGWNFAAGISVPYAALIGYPDTVIDPNRNNDAVPGPQRYSVISPAGTALAQLGVFAAKSFLGDRLEVGIGPRLLFGQFSTTVALSSCPGPLLCAQQDPTYDSVSKVSSTIITPSATAGAIFKIDQIWRVGLSMDLPTWVDAPASIQVRLPQAAVFSGASVQGKDARMQFKLPFVGRVGVEARPIAGLRVEFAAVFEGWSIHDKISILRPSATHGVDLLNVTGFPARYPIGDLTVQRNFRDTFSLRLGGEYIGGNIETFSYRFRLGFMYERSAVPTNSFSALSNDPDKLMPTLGVSLGLYRFRLDITYAEIVCLGVKVDPATANIYATNPVRDPTAGTAGLAAVNGGSYSMNARVIGLALAYQFK